MKPILLTLALLVATLDFACGETLALDDRACPCAEGYVCCASANVCARSLSQCPADDTEGADAAADAADAADEAAPKLLASAQSARCLTAAGGRVYWQNANGLIVGAAADGSKLETSNLNTPTANNSFCGIAVEGTRLFTTAFSLGKLVELALESNGEWAIGGSIRLFGALRGPSSVAIDADWVYATEYEGGTITRFAKDQGDQASVLAAGLARPFGLVADDATLYWLERGTPAGADAGSPAALVKLAKTGGTPTTLPTGEHAPVAFTLRAGRIYWTDAAGSVSAMDADGTHAETLAKNQIAAGSVVSDDETVFWSTANAIRAIPRTGGEISTRHDSVPLAESLTLDDTRLFWVSNDQVWSATK